MQNMHKGITTVVTFAKHVQTVIKSINVFDCNSLTHFSKIIILVPKDSSLRELYNVIMIQ